MFSALSAIALTSELLGCQAPRQAEETKNRLSSERLEELVAGPMDVVRQNGLGAGKASFEQLLAKERGHHGAESHQVADLLMAFGVGLYLEWRENKSPESSDAAIHYFAESVAAYRKAFGSDHPEVAVALSTYADAIEQTESDVPPEKVEAAEREALAIRTSRLGEANLETRASMLSLANFLRLQSKRMEDPSAVEAEQIYRKAIALAKKHPTFFQGGNLSEARLKLARLYAMDSTAERALRQVELAGDELRRSDPDDRNCSLYYSNSARLAESLRDAGHASAARVIDTADSFDFLCLFARE